MVVFSSKDNYFRITQIHLSFLDGWDYAKQAQYANMIAKNFGLDKAYFDNTRSELEDRMLDSVWIPIRFSIKSKRRMAQLFENYVHSGKIELIKNERQHSQVICVDNNLEAPETPLGHGDAFWAIALAVMAHHDATTSGTTIIGDMSDWDTNRGSQIQTRNFGFDKKDLKEYCPKCGESAGWVKEKKLCIICKCDDLLKQDLSGTVSNFPMN